MATTTTPLGTLLPHSITQETDIENTGYSNVRGSPVSLMFVEFVAAAACYVKLYDDNGDGLDYDNSDPSYMIINIPGAATVNCIIEVEGGEGLPFKNGLSFAASQTAGDDLADAPAASCIGRFVTREL